MLVSVFFTHVSFLLFNFNGLDRERMTDNAGKRNYCIISDNS
ncbi:hypothetical protein PXD04_10265 [Methanosphaera sp. ISO3-F5]|nr:hypothetical protein [Methanosphaera sp. ISO3-F5]WQH64074.1 hypothetical protein PXD04_10265 [Methanosphaera sp. ISO3-F5]